MARGAPLPSGLAARWFIIRCVLPRALNVSAGEIDPWGPGLKATDMKAICSRIGLFAFLLLHTAINGRPASANHVLALNGVGQYVELPPKLLSDLKDATFEAWFLWGRYGGRVIDYGSSMRDINIAAGPAGVGLDMASPDDDLEPFKSLEHPALLDKKWHHVAAVCGQTGMRLFLDGTQVASGTYRADSTWSVRRDDFTWAIRRRH